MNLGNHRAHKPRWGPDSSTSEVTTIQLEFRELSRFVHQISCMQASRLPAHSASHFPNHRNSAASRASLMNCTCIPVERLTGNSKYDDAVTTVMEHVRGLPKKDGLVPIFINANSGR